MDDVLCLRAWKHTEQKTWSDWIFKNGVFFVNRSGKAFSRVAADMALEQTINAEAKNCLKGIVAFADINSAVNKWQVTSSMKTRVITNLLEMTEIKNYNAETKELNHPRI